MKEKVAAYVRVSTAGQNSESQVNEINRFCEESGLEPEFFSDVASGESTERPALSEMEDRIRNGQFKKVIVYRIDRLFRSVENALEITNFLFSKNVAILSVGEDASFSKKNKSFLHFALSYAELENQVRKERQAVGIANAKAKGIYLGRKKGTIKGDPKVVKALREEGKTLKEITEVTGLCMSTVQRYLR